MPLYEMHCPECGAEDEVLRPMGQNELYCSCGSVMVQKPSFPAMVKYGHGYPSRRKMRNGTAPYCGAQKADYGNYTEREAVTVHGAPYT